MIKLTRVGGSISAHQQKVFEAVVNTHKQLGVYAEYDSHFRWKTGEENFTYTLPEQLLPDDAHRIVTGLDTARNTYYKIYGGKPDYVFYLLHLKAILKKWV